MVYKSRGQKKWEKESQWHKWFAWYPVGVETEKIWLEHVEREKYMIPGVMATFVRYRKLSKDNKEIK